MGGNPHRSAEVYAGGDDGLEADLATLIAAFRDMAHPVSSLSRDADPPDGWDGAGWRMAYPSAPSIPPSRHQDAWGLLLDRMETSI